MAKWYDQYLTESEKKNAQVSTKAARARQRKATQDANVANAQRQTLERERQSGEAYARKMQKDTSRSKEILQNAFVQKAYNDAKRNKR
jgi:hypothetical protein